MSTDRVAVTVKRASFSISRPGSQKSSSTHGVDAIPALRWWLVLAAFLFAAGFWAFPYRPAWGQTAPSVLGLPQGIASVVAEQLQRLAKQGLMPAQEKVDSHLRRLAWPSQAEAQAVTPPVVPPPWQQG